MRDFSDSIINLVNPSASRIYNERNVIFKYSIYSEDDLDEILFHLSQNTLDYWKLNGTTNYLQSLQKTNEMWSNWANGEPSPEISGLVNQISLSLGESPKMLRFFGIYPLCEILLTKLPVVIDEIREIGQFNHKGPHTFGNGLIAYNRKKPIEKIKSHGLHAVLIKAQTYPKPKLIAQYLPGNVVGAPWLTFSLGPGQITKLPSGDPLSALAYLHTLNIIDPKLRSTIVSGYWKGGNKAIERKVNHSVDSIFAMGASDAMVSIKESTNDLAHLSRRTHLHGHKIGFAVISKEYAKPEIASLLSMSVTANNTLACYSPQNIYVEKGGELSPSEFANIIAEELEEYAHLLPPNRDSITLNIVTRYLEQTTIYDPSCKIIARNGYAIIYSGPKELEATCGFRTIRVISIDSINDLPKFIAKSSNADLLQSVELAVPSTRLPYFLIMLNSYGVSNIHAPGEAFVFTEFDPHDGIYDHAKLYFEDFAHWTYLNFTNTDDAIYRATKRQKLINCLLTNSDQQ